jgi:hypothetical protein
MTERPARMSYRSIERNAMLEVTAVSHADWCVGLGSGAERPLQPCFDLLAAVAQDCQKAVWICFVVEDDAESLPDWSAREQRGQRGFR